MPVGSKQNSGTLAWLQTVFFVNEKTGWIGGSSGILLETRDGGNSWKQAEKFTGDTIREIYFSDENNGWMLCERDIYNLASNAPSYLLKTTNGGADWEKIEFSGGGRFRIAKIFFSENGAGFAVGESGALFILQEDRKTWKKQPSPIRYLLLDGAFTDKRNGVMVGAGGNIFFTEDAGFSWNRSNLSGAPDIKLNAVFFANKQTGWTVGADGKIFQTVSGGKNWREQKSGVSVNLNDIFFINSAEGWIVGDEGTLLHSTTAGNVWTKLDAKVRHKLEKIFFKGKKGWAVGFGGTILRYDAENRENNRKIYAPVLSRNAR